MARPAATDSADTRRRLLDAASEAFARQGLRGTALRDVAAAAGVTIAVVHYHFGSKERLYEACIAAARAGLRSEFAPFRALLDDIRARVRGAASAPLEFEPLLESIVRTGNRAVRRRRDALRLLMRGLIEVGKLDERWLNDSLAPFLAEIATLVAEPLGIPSAELRLRIQSLVALVVRNALSSPEELAVLAGRRRASQTRVLAIYEDHMVWIARTILLGG